MESVVMMNSSKIIDDGNSGVTGIGEVDGAGVWFVEGRLLVLPLGWEWVLV
jgi:hypothetical protein